MNISKQKKAETRQKLVQAAIDLFTEQGFQKTTMKAIARRAEVGDATIYKYFSSKDKLVLAFYQLRAEETIQKLVEIDTQDYDLHEQLQLLIDLYLESLLPDREFVVDSAKKVLAAQSFMNSDTPTIRQEFNGVINQFLDQAEACEEIPYFHYRGMIVGLINEYLMGVLLYWLKDDSDEFSNTTQMVDLSLTLGVQLLRSGIPNKINDLLSFLIKRHLLNFTGAGGGVMAILKGVMANTGASGMFDQWQPENRKPEAE
jgi:AcrR family transcriptional regulator|tara:strand:- start:3336 stop:4109 length:774 start_codon:yes stop_codon:yes gene_type:complete